MKKNLLPWQLLTLTAVLAPSLYLLYVWPQLPAQVPTHFDGGGQANGYTSRDHVWLLTLGAPLGIALFFSILPYLDPKRRLDSSSANFQKLRLAVVAMLGGLASYSLYLALHPGTEGRGLLVLVGRFVPLGLVILAPILVNILLFHALFEPRGIIPGIVLSVLEVFMIYVYRASFRGLFDAAPEVS